MPVLSIQTLAGAFHTAITVVHFCVSQYGFGWGVVGFNVAQACRLYAIAYARMNSQTNDYDQAVTGKMVSEHSGVDL